ncbi:SHOCT domain-containing protein [Agrilactobacillus fermenti]|uniref:SHOCT domain-containing protein n=1 Tax=Agrilactobacillus fermenti TaxID=2586909 RepID=UPI003A5C5CF1
MSSNETGYKQRVVRKAPITFYNSTSRKSVNGGVILPKIYQLDDDTISFNLKDSTLYHLISIKFDGPVFHEEVVETNTPGKQTIKKKRHGLSGAIIGGALTGGIGAVAGGLVGHGMGKDKITGEAGTNSTTTQRVEDQAHTVLTLENINTKETINLQLLLFNSEYIDLTSFKLYARQPEEIDVSTNKIVEEKNIITKDTQRERFDEIREYKSLLDEGIITQEEFNAKKKDLLGF